MTAPETPDPFAPELSDREWLRAHARFLRRRGVERDALRCERIADRLERRERKVAA